MVGLAFLDFLRDGVKKPVSWSGWTTDPPASPTYPGRCRAHLKNSVLLGLVHLACQAAV